jgi:hypothetical protein
LKGRCGDTEPSVLVSLKDILTIASRPSIFPDTFPLDRNSPTPDFIPTPPCIP